MHSILMKLNSSNRVDFTQVDQVIPGDKCQEIRSGQEWKSVKRFITVVLLLSFELDEKYFEEIVLSNLRLSV
jgi:hypothetical protein